MSEQSVFQAGDFNYEECSLLSSSGVSKSCSTFTDLSSVFSSVSTLKVSSAIFVLQIGAQAEFPPNHEPRVIIKNRFESAVASSLRESLSQDQ